MNIWAPKGHSADDDPLPVLVWLLPGGFTSGYVANPLYSKFHALDIHPCRKSTLLRYYVANHLQKHDINALLVIGSSDLFE